MEQCNRHEETTKRICNLEDRVRELEISDQATKVEIRNLIKQMEKLVTTIETFMQNTRKMIMGISGTALTILVGFLLWYIQRL